MDVRITKQPVRVCTRVMSQTAEQPVEAAVTLPDTCSDLKRLLRCRVRPCVTAARIGGDRLSVEGEATVSLCYVDRDGGIRGYEQVEPFSHEFELPRAVAEGRAEVRPRIVTLNYKTVSERRVDVRFAVLLNASVTGCETMEIVTDVDDPSVQQQRGSRPCTAMVGSDEKVVLVSDEMTLPDDVDSIRSVLRAEPRVTVSDVRVTGGKAVVKGDLLIKLLYVGEESGSCACAAERFPFSQVFDIAGLTDRCDCTVDAAVVGCETRPRTDMSGMLRKVLLGARLNLGVTAYCPGEVPYLTDAYSTEREMSLTRAPLALERVAYTSNEPVTVTRKLDLPVSSIERVLDVTNDAEITSVTCTDSTVTLKGVLQVFLLTLDPAGEPMAFERTVDFTVERDLPQPVEGAECRAQVTPLNVIYALGRGELEIQSELQVRLEAVEHASCEVIADVALGDKLKSRYAASSIVICRARAGEPLWEVAKRYHTSPGAVADLNEMSGDVLDADRTLVIPVGCA